MVGLIGILIDILFLLAALAIVVETFWPRWSFRDGARAPELQALFYLVIKLVGLVLVWVIVKLLLGALLSAIGAAGHPVALGVGSVAAFALLLGLAGSPPQRPLVADQPPSPSPPGLPYVVSWWIGLLITLGLVTITLIDGAASSLGLDMRAVTWLGIVSGVLGVAGRFFPNVQQTVAARAAELGRAMAGTLPRDVAPPR